MRHRDDAAPGSRVTHWSWVQFSFGAVLGGLMGFLEIDNWSHIWYVHMVQTLVGASVCGALAGRYGDRAWEWMTRWILPW